MRLVAQEGDSRNGALALGTLHTNAGLHLSTVVSRFIGMYPKMPLLLKTDTSCSLTSDVVDGRLDGAIVAGPVDHPELHVETICSEELVVVTARTLLPLESLLAEMDIHMATLLEFESIDAIIACVAAGIGITLLPRGVLGTAAERAIVGIHTIATDSARIETLFIRRHDAHVTNAMQAFIEIARSHKGATP